ncbi:uncharacterized protein LOC129456749 [Periophthalmus magnuspinnatus]|uniref:uncharacterized protein LOC129456749 n=1 Tax=Periophthalmus magnuspinnatus TaxID=409849 RepID=UPI00243698ED|nr:uncharacterized protein LOC129456749 [Periophthalmus magnuspinnatus]
MQNCHISISGSLRQARHFATAPSVKGVCESDWRRSEEPVTQIGSCTSVSRIEKPMAQGPPGGVIGVLGGVVAIGLIIGVGVTVFMVHRRQQKTRTETDNDLTDLPPAHKPAPPKKKNSDMKGHLTSDDIQVVHLDKEEEMQKLPLQPPYYDMAPSESTAFTDKPNSGHKDCDVQYAELDTAALASSPSPRSSAHTGPGDLVETPGDVQRSC